MNEIFKASLLTLQESYSNHPIAKALISILPPFTATDSLLTTYVENIKRDRLKTFFDELSSGDVTLTQDMIENNEFLHAFFSTVDYVMRTRSDKKILAFARILKRIETISFDEYEDYTSILNELTEREFALLSLKYKYEKENSVRYVNDGHIKKYWEKFKNQACELGFNYPEIPLILMRVQRTGCYQINLRGSYGNNTRIHNTYGNTTIIFRKIYSLATEENE